MSVDNTYTITYNVFANASIEERKTFTFNVNPNASKQNNKVTAIIGGLIQFIGKFIKKNNSTNYLDIKILNIFLLECEGCGDLLPLQTLKDEFLKAANILPGLEKTLGRPLNNEDINRIFQYFPPDYGNMGLSTSSLSSPGSSSPGSPRLLADGGKKTKKSTKAVKAAKFTPTTKKVKTPKGERCVHKSARGVDYVKYDGKMTPVSKVPKKSKK